MAEKKNDRNKFRDEMSNFSRVLRRKRIIEYPLRKFDVIPLAKNMWKLIRLTYNISISEDFHLRKI